MHSIEKRFWSHVRITSKERDCWRWTGSIDLGGYARMRTPLTGLAHRVSYELFKGPIPSGLALDHVCRVRHCVNPHHLEAVTAAENCRRATRNYPTSNDPSATACKNGHALTGANVSLRKSGVPECVTCRREAHRMYYRKAEAARVAKLRAKLDEEVTLQIRAAFGR